MSSDKGEDQVRWNSWCISKMKKTCWDFLPFHKDSWCFNALNHYTCGHLLILMLYMFVIFVVYFFYIVLLLYVCCLHPTINNFIRTNMLHI